MSDGVFPRLLLANATRANFKTWQVRSTPPQMVIIGGVASWVAHVAIMAAVRL